MIVILPSIKDIIINEVFTKDLRTKINHLSVEVIKEYPITGIGFGMQIYGNESLINLEKCNIQLTEEFRLKNSLFLTHNTMLDITVRIVIVGLFLYLYILLTAFL